MPNRVAGRCTPSTPRKRGRRPRRTWQRVVAEICVCVCTNTHTRTHTNTHTHTHTHTQWQVHALNPAAEAAPHVAVGQRVVAEINCVPGGYALYLTQSIDGLVSESQLPHNTVNLMI